MTADRGPEPVDARPTGRRPLRSLAMQARTSDFVAALAPRDPRVRRPLVRAERVLVAREPGIAPLVHVGVRPAPGLPREQGDAAEPSGTRNPLRGLPTGHLPWTTPARRGVATGEPASSRPARTTSSAGDGAAPDAAPVAGRSTWTASDAAPPTVATVAPSPPSGGTARSEPTAPRTITAQPFARQPFARQPFAAQPFAAQPFAAQPLAAQPVAASADSSGPAPKSAAPAPAVRAAGAPDAAAPHGRPLGPTQHAAVPHAAVPDTAVPDTAVPDTAVPDTAVPGPTAPDTVVDTHLAPVRVRRGRVADRLTDLTGSRAAHRDGIVHLPDRHGPITSPAAQSLLAHELVHAAADRRGRPAGDTGEAAAAEERHAAAVEAAVRTGTLPGPAVTPQPRCATSTAVDRTWSGDSGATGAPAPPATARTAPDGAATEDSVPPTGPHAVHRAAEAPLPPEPASRTSPAEDLDRLYREIRERLRHDLLLERERTGHLVDPVWR